MKTAAIHQDHATFRVVLQAMSHPGTSCQLPIQVSVTGEYTPLIQLLSCLMDNEVSFTIVGDDGGSLAADLSLRTGSAQVDIDKSDFVIATRGTTSGQLSRIKRGTLEYPDGGATLVYMVDEIAGEGGEAVLSGPGVNGTVRPLLTGLAISELRGLREINIEYPLGVDAIFLDTNGRIACIPRSTRIGEY
jgi:alpha-D-ribose 1-methylphosphonate 5-triphosphate synthase subunit PhnH